MDDPPSFSTSLCPDLFEELDSGEEHRQLIKNRQINSKELCCMFIRQTEAHKLGNGLSYGSHLVYLEVIPVFKDLWEKK